MGKIRVGVIFGGRSGEHEVSLVSAASVMNAIDKSRFEVVPIGITKEGRWLLSGDPMRQLQASSDGQARLSDRTEEVVDRRLAPAFSLLPSVTAPLQLDVIFPLVHGTYGEDGTLQGLLELADIPYVGAGVLGSSVGMDKVVMKAVFRHYRIPTVGFQLVLRSEWEANRERSLDQTEKRLGYPCFVKPANLGSSVGISKARDRQELEDAIDIATIYDRRVIVEQGVDGRELECAVLGNDDPVASAVGEIVPCNEFYDYSAKYINEGTRLIIPAEILPAVEADVRRLAVRAFKTIDCAGLGRVDFFLRKGDGKLFVNEINTIPGFTSISMYPKLWEQSGVSYPELIERLIGLAFERYAAKKRNKTHYERQH